MFRRFAREGIAFSGIIPPIICFEALWQKDIHFPIQTESLFDPLWMGMVDRAFFVDMY
jgi:hypothetical protein